MGWSMGYDSHWNRDIGYGVIAVCDHPACNETIDRGLAYVCCDQEPYGGENGCGLYFCDAHRPGGRCERCAAGEDPFPAKPDCAAWFTWKLTDASWEAWRGQALADNSITQQQIEEAGLTVEKERAKCADDCEWPDCDDWRHRLEVR